MLTMFDRVMTQEDIDWELANCTKCLALAEHNLRQNRNSNVARLEVTGWKDILAQAKHRATLGPEYQPTRNET